MQKTKLSDTDFAEISGLKWEINELKHRINKLEKTPKETEWQRDEEYYYITEYGYIYSEVWTNGTMDIDLLKYGNIFSTEQDAENHKLRIESLSKGTANKGEDFWIWDFDDGKAIYMDAEDYKYYLQSTKFRTEDECEEWYKKYGKAWLELIK